MPLNIFEPRYLAMVDVALADRRIIGMIQPDERAPPAERGPSLCTVGCAGRITSFAETGDGNFDAAADIDGNGSVDASDREFLNSTFGSATNQAPTANASNLTTHINLPVRIPLTDFASDPEADRLSYQILGSSNGTFINDRPCPAQVAVPLDVGDHLRLGAETFRVVRPQEAEP